MSMDFFYPGEEEVLFNQNGVLEESREMSAEDAYVYSMNDKGCVDLDYMEAISGISSELLADKLIGHTILPDPEIYENTGDYIGCFTSKQQYLTGNLIRKYKRALEINKKYGLFAETIEVLVNSLPQEVEPEEIHINLASTWVPKKYVVSFVKQLLGMEKDPVIDYIDHLGKWTINTTSSPNRILNGFEYGTERMPAIDIIKHMLNARPVKVFDQIPKRDGKEGFENRLNKAETLAAQQKEARIQREWQNYVHNDSDIEKHLQDVYMDYYGYSICRYDGAFLKLPELNEDIKPYPHQLNAIARIVQNKNTLLAHEVGSGKTLEYMCGVHELIRMELGHKAIIVLPNNTLDSAVNTYKELYKDDKVFAIYPKTDFSPKDRHDTIERIKSNEYSVIFMAYSSFDMLSLSYEYKEKKREDEIKELKRLIDNGRNATTNRALEAEKGRKERALLKFQYEYEYKETACFDYLGVDILVVDEAHNYKNITLDNKNTDIVGVHNVGSKKADNMLEIVEYIQSIDGHVIFATGTPITNSMCDLYTFQRYLQPSELKVCSIYHFNDWISTFCSESHSFEVDVDSKNYRYTTRFSKFHNMPELMSMFSGVCDFYQVANGELQLPDFNGYTDVLVKKSEIQKDYIDDLAKRTEDIRAKNVSKYNDNLLLITSDGRKCALDVRLVINEADVSNDETKVKVCAANMARLYFDYPNATQIAFCDISTPKDGFNIYDELKSELVKLNVPELEIKFIHEATNEAMRERMEKLFNDGKIRILIGSTQKLGTGTNVQEKLIAVHHVDVPWRPADMVQREGRIIRQGNENKEVFVYRYVTEASFDAYTYQILENKQKFISQFLSGSLDAVHREESDCADTVLSYAEIKALAIGNPLIKERVETSNELEHARINQRVKRKELNNLSDVLTSLPRKIERKLKYIKNAKYDATFYKHNKKKIPNEERKSFGEELIFAFLDNVDKVKERLFETYQGFSVCLPKNMKIDEPFVVIRGGSENLYTIKMDDVKPMGCSKRIDYFLDHFSELIAEQEKALADLYAQKKNAKEIVDAGNEFDELVYNLLNRLEDIDKKLEESKI